ncbi:MAG: hypothetical protein QXQ39_07505 [Conexivisphaerales archaeon]
MKSQVERLTKHASEKGYEIVNVYEKMSSGLNFIVEDLDSDNCKLGFELASIQDRTRLSLKNIAYMQLIKVHVSALL